MAASVEALITGFSRCTDCHRDRQTQPYLLTGDSLAIDPPLQVKPRAWYPPRGWGGTLASGKRSVLFLSTNPGHPFPDEEDIWDGFPADPATAAQLTEPQAVSQLRYVSSFYVERPSAFHTKSVRMARAILWLIDRKDRGSAPAAAWADRIWFSDVVKCSTARERGSPGIPELAHRCRRHLVDEVGFFDPSVVVTLGDGARDAFQAAAVAVPALLALPHPSSFGRWFRIDDRGWDPTLQGLSRKLAIEWRDVESDFMNARRILQANARARLS